MQSLLVTSATALPFSYLPYGLDFIKLPSILKVHTGVWKPRTLNLKEEAFRNLRVSLLKAAVKEFQPDVILVDYTPKGVWNELEPIFARLKQQQRSPMLILGLRDILDIPAEVRKVWEREGNYDFINKYYDKVLIYGIPEVFDTARAYGLNGKATYCGYICSEPSFESRESFRKKFGVGKEKLIVIAAGGGYDAFPTMNLVVAALKEVFQKTCGKAIFITGPLMNPENLERLEYQAKKLPIEILHHADTTSCLNSADLVITMAGYNTLMDSLLLGKDVIVIPRKGPSAEQRMRAEIFAERGWITTLKPSEELSVEELSKTVLQRLHKPHRPSFTGQGNGAANIIHEIKMLLERRDSKEPVGT